MGKGKVHPRSNVTSPGSQFNEFSNSSFCHDHHVYWLWSDVRRLAMSAGHIISYFCAWKTTNIFIYCQQIDHFELCSTKSSS